MHQIESAEPSLHCSLQAQHVQRFHRIVSIVEKEDGLSDSMSISWMYIDDFHLSKCYRTVRSFVYWVSCSFICSLVFICISMIGGFFAPRVVSHPILILELILISESILIFFLTLQWTDYEMNVRMRQQQHMYQQQHEQLRQREQMAQVTNHAGIFVGGVMGGTRIICREIVT